MDGDDLMDSNTKKTDNNLLNDQVIVFDNFEENDNYRVPEGKKKLSKKNIDSTNDNCNENAEGKLVKQVSLISNDDDRP